MEVNHLELPYEEKELGKKHWDEGDYMNASKSYSKALLAINYLIKEQRFTTTEQAEAMIKDVQLPCLLNLAACYIKMGYCYSNVISHCTDALKIQKNNVKALYRRAIGYTYTDKFKEAKDDIDLALKIEPENKSILRALENLNKRKTNYRSKTKKIAKKAFEASETKEASIEPTPNLEDNKKIPWWKCAACRRKIKKS